VQAESLPLTRHERDRRGDTVHVDSPSAGSSTPRSTSSAGPPKNRDRDSGQPQTRKVKLRSVAPKKVDEHLQDSSESDEDEVSARSEVIRLRKKLHIQACELQETRSELDRTRLELSQAKAEVDELRLKHSNLERSDRKKSSELLDQLRKNDELGKQVKAMSQNLLTLSGSVDNNAASQDSSSLRKRCFKLVQQNTQLTMQSQLLSRQKGWAEAKARVLQKEVTGVYLGTHGRVKDARELEVATENEFLNGNPKNSGARIYSMLENDAYKYKEVVVDFITHVNHTHGKDIEGFLNSDRVFSEEIRKDCLQGIAREFHAQWQLNRSLPKLLRAAERLIHLSDYQAAFDSFSAEIAQLLKCGHAKIWIADHVRGCLKTSTREGEHSRAWTLPLPKEGCEDDLQGRGLAVAAYATQKMVNIADASNDPRFQAGVDAGPDGHAMSIMCLPICKTGRGVVLQAINKLDAPTFDAEADSRVLRLLGNVSMEVVAVCDAISAQTTNTKRKEALLQILNDFLPCTKPTQLLHALEQGLQNLFLSQAAALHLVTSAGSGASARLQLDRSRKLVWTPCDTLRGLVAQVTKTMNTYSVPASLLEDSRHDPNTDIAVPDKTVLHTVPICVGATCMAVCQFLCPERELAMTGDDGAYHPEYTSHFRILAVLITFVENHLFVLSRFRGRLAEAVGEEVTETFPQHQEESDSESVEDGASKREKSAAKPKPKSLTTKGKEALTDLKGGLKLSFAESLGEEEPRENAGRDNAGTSDAIFSQSEGAAKTKAKSTPPTIRKSKTRHL